MPPRKGALRHSRYSWISPYFYSVSKNLAYVQMFGQQDLVCFSQTGSAKGKGNPAWNSAG